MSLFGLSGCHSAFTGGGTVPGPAHKVDGQGFAGGDAAWARILLDRGALITTLQQLSATGDFASVCADCVVNPANPICRKVQQMPSAERSDARAFIQNAYQKILAVLLRDPRTLFELSDTPWTIDGQYASARTILGPEGFIELFVTDWLAMESDESEAVIFHEAGHKVVFDPLGKALADTDAWNSFASSFGGKDLLTKAGLCMVAYRIEHPVSLVVPSVSQLRIDINSTQSANGLSLTNAGPGVTVTTVALTPPFILKEGCAVGHAVAPGCTAQLGIAAGTADGDYTGSLAFTFSNGQNVTIGLTARLARATGLVINADNDFVSQARPCGTATKMSFSNESSDPAGLFDASQSRFTPGAGRWLINAATRLSPVLPSANSSLQLSLYRNGSLEKSGPLSRMNYNPAGATLTYVVDSRPGDYFEIYAMYADCTAPHSTSGAPADTWLELVSVPVRGPVIHLDNAGAAQSVKAVVSTPLAFSNVTGDVTSLFDKTKARFTPGPGRWLVNAAALFADQPQPSSYFELELHKNGSLYRSGPRSAGSRSRPGGGLSYVVEAQAGDYFELHALYGASSAGASAVNLSGAITETWLQLVPLAAPVSISAHGSNFVRMLGCGGWTKIRFPNEAGDVGDLYDATLSRFVPGSGTWLIQAVATLSDPEVNSSTQLGIFKNGTRLKFGNLSTTHDRRMGSGISYVVDAAPGDFFEIYGYYVNCSAENQLMNMSANGWLSITRWDGP